jgi:hypothetical protein
MTPFRTSPLLTTLPLALGLGACVDGNADAGLTVLHVIAPQTGCTFDTASSAILGAGIIESGAPGGYLMGPEIRNDLATADGEAKTPKTVFLTGAQVEIEFYDDTLFTAAERSALAADGLTRFVVPFSGSVEPDGGSTVVPFEAVPVALLRRIGDRLPEPSSDDPAPRAVLDVRFQVTGTRGGGGVESNLFRYPVQVCNDCLTTYLGSCAALASNEPIATGGVCQLVQDGHVDCCVADHDDLEVPCGPEDPTPPPDRVCDNGVDDPASIRCPARLLEL